MKRTILLLLLCAVLVLTMGCGGQETSAPTDSNAESAADTTPPADTAENAAEPAETADEESEAAAPTVEEQIELVQGLIDAPVDELYEAIGQPADSAYASSCLGEGEDGELYYDGFTVYTYRDTDGSESVYDVMPASGSGS